MSWQQYYWFHIKLCGITSISTSTPRCSVCWQSRVGMTYDRFRFSLVWAGTGWHMLLSPGRHLPPRGPGEGWHRCSVAMMDCATVEVLNFDINTFGMPQAATAELEVEFRSVGTYSWFLPSLVGISCKFLPSYERNRTSSSVALPL